MRLKRPDTWDQRRTTCRSALHRPGATRFLAFHRQSQYQHAFDDRLARAGPL